MTDQEIKVSRIKRDGLAIIRKKIIYFLKLKYSIFPFLPTFFVRVLISCVFDTSFLNTKSVYMYNNVCLYIHSN
jgi:hypothetical protein